MTLRHLSITWSFVVSAASGSRDVSDLSLAVPFDRRPQRALQSVASDRREGEGEEVLLRDLREGIHEEEQSRLPHVLRARSQTGEGDASEIRLVKN